jgi:predicted TIM-barrel fold metal-dependent hydrolase
MIPRIVSVDDHVIEPPTVWVDRLPSDYRDTGPRVERHPLGEMTFRGGRFAFRPGTEGPQCDWWHYEDLLVPHTRLAAAAGFSRDDVKVAAITYEQMRPGCWQSRPRLDDMDEAWIEASLCFPTFPRFCGQTFLEAADKDLALLCVQAYNDWMVEEWCDGSGGRLVPLVIVPLWDPELAATEVRRNATRGVRAICFSEVPPFLGLPSIHERHWDPLWAACAETGTIVNMHIGSGSKMPSTSEDAPAAVGSTLTSVNSILSLTDWLFSGVFVRFPGLKIAYAEGQIGWVPYFLERADHVWESNRAWGGVGESVPEPPSTYYRTNVYGCFFSDRFGLQNLPQIGENNVMFECDYPHSDSNWPHTKKVAEQMTSDLSPEQTYKVLRGNAIALYGLQLAP